MASDKYIIRQVKDITTGKYTKWQIGLTGEPLNRKAQLGNPLTWLHWKADSEQEARNVEQFFLDKGLQGTGATHWPGLYVFILKLE